VYCGCSLFGHNFSLVDFDVGGELDFPDSPKFDFLKMRLKFDDVDRFQFDMGEMKEMAPCKLPFITSGNVPGEVKD
jgi:hypothetical protein